MLVHTQNFVKEYGSEILHHKDGKGHTTAHWACLGGHLELLQYLIEQGVDINRQSDADPQPLPIHWACTKGHIGNSVVCFGNTDNQTVCSSNK